IAGTADSLAGWFVMEFTSIWGVVICRIPPPSLLPMCDSRTFLGLGGDEDDARADLRRAVMIGIWCCYRHSWGVAYTASLATIPCMVRFAQSRCWPLRQTRPA